MNGNASVDDDLGDVTSLYAGHLFPGVQARTFQHTDQLFPTRLIRRSGDVRYFPRATGTISDMLIRSADETHDLYDYVSRNRIAGLMIIADGQIQLEHYELGHGPHTRWLSMSMAKSFSTTLVGVAIADGHIASVDDNLTQYLPQLSGGGYDGVSIRHLLQMTSGVEWDDTHTKPQSHRRRMLELQIAQQHDAILGYMASRPRVAEPGTRWNYSTGETHVVGALVKAVTGEWLADYLSDKIWARLGMEQDAHWWLEAPDGLEVAGSGMCATLPDYMRFAQFMLDGGRIDGNPIVPDGWIDEATRPRLAGGQLLNYGFMWWPVAGADGQFTDKAYSARGIFGQYLYINPARKIIVGVHSSRAKPKFSEAVSDNDFFNAVCEALG